MSLKSIQLQKPILTGGMPVVEALVRRRSVRSFSPEELTISQISQLLWAGQGLTGTKFPFRAAPSAGGLYPLQLLILTKEGIFRYFPDKHELSCFSGEDQRAFLARSSLNQTFIGGAPLIIVITGDRGVLEVKYGARSDRYLFLEVGHVAQNIHLQAVALGLVSVPIGAFHDEAVSKLLALPDREKPLYIIPVGHPQPSLG